MKLDKITAHSDLQPKLLDPVLDQKKTLALQMRRNFHTINGKIQVKLWFAETKRQESFVFCFLQLAIML